jgi:hypothetical protein
MSKFKHNVNCSNAILSKTAKTIIIFIFLLMNIQNVVCQTNVDVVIQVSEPYPVEFEYYLENADNLYISVSNNSASDLDVYYHVRLTGDNGLEALTKPGIKPSTPVNIPSFRTLFYTGNDLSMDFPFDYPSQVNLTTASPQQRDFINLNRALPEGSYQICITVFNYNTDAILSEECSDPFTVSYGDAPFIIMPFNNEIIPENPMHHVTIGWEPPFTSRPATGTFIYNLKIVDITGYPFGDIELLMNNPGTYPILDVSDLPDLIYNYDYPPETELIPGHQYAVRVQAVNNTGSYPLPNNGYSEISTFWYGHDESGEEEETTIANASCEGGECVPYPVNINATATANISGFSELKIGHFTIKELNITNSNGNNASGTGTIVVPFFDNVKISVAFEGVKVDPTKRIFEGDVVAINDYTYNPGTATPADISNLDRLIRSERLISKFIGGQNRTMTMPMGIVWNVGGEHLMLGFNTMVFSPDRASCQIMYNMHYPQWNDYWLSLSASDICMMPDGFGQEFYLHPVVDIPLPNIGDTEYYVKGTTSNDPNEILIQATFVQVDCHGIANMGQNIEVRYSRSVIVPDENDGSQGDGRVSGRITLTFPRTAQTTELGNSNKYSVGFLGQYSMDRFQIRSLPGLGFELNEGWVDFSDTKNAPGMKVPSNYQSPDLSQSNGQTTLSPLWEGFYMKSLTARSAEGWLFDEERLTFSVEDMIYDDLLTAKIKVSNLITNGDINDWFVSLDTFSLELVQWSVNNTGLWNASINGRIGMPITGENEFFRYTGLLQPQETGTSPNMALIVNPHNGGMTFPFMQAGIVNLCPNSYIRLVQENGNTYFDSQLAGNVAVTFTNPITVTIPYIDFQFGYHSTIGFSNQAFSILGQRVTGEVVDCSNITAPPEIAMGDHQGTGSGTSGSGSSSSGGASGSSSSSGSGSSLPPPMPAGTPVSANNFPMGIEGLEINQISLGNVNFNIRPRIELGGGGQSGFGADTEFGIKSVKRNKKLSFDGIDLESLSIDIEDVFGININGSIEFYQENADKGARGELIVDLPLKISTELKADFGVRAINTSNTFGQTVDYFGYWYVDGMVGFPGIPLLPGIHLHGLGGGVYVNMNRNDGYANDAAAQAIVDDVLGQLPSNVNASVASTPDELRPYPAYGQYGLKLATRFATAVEAALNMDVSIAGTFAQGIGINSLQIDGAAYMMSPLDKRESNTNVWATAGLGWETSNGNHVIQGNIDLYANIGNGLLTGMGSNDKVVDVDFLAETQSGKWYFKAGNPDDRAGLMLDLAIIKQEVNGYFMLGHDIPSELPMPDEVRSLLGRSSGSGSNKLNNPSPVNGTINRSEGDGYYGDGQGIAFGVETSVEYNLRAWALYASLKAYLGFDINITQSEGGTCYIPGEGQIAPGVNGWYATGQIYAGFEGEMGLKGKFLGKEREFQLFSMAAAMLIKGGGPNPTWAEGRATASYNVLNGLIKGSAGFDLSVGNKCEPAPEVTDMIPVIHELTPSDGQKQVSIFEDILATFLVPIDERIEVPIIWEPVEGVRRLITADIEIYIDEFSIKNDATNSIVSNTKKYNADRQAVTLEGETFDSQTDYTVTLRVKAIDYTFVSSGVPLKEDDKDWMEERIHSFKTGKSPFPIPDDQIVKTLPIRNQRYFLQDEINVLYKLQAPLILFASDMSNNDYFPDDDDDNTYEYFFRWANYDGDEPIIIDANDLKGKSPVQLIMNKLPTLKNDSYYSCQLIKKTNKRSLIGLATNQGIKISENIISSNTALIGKELFRQDTISINIDIDPSMFKNKNEEIIYQFDFKTSKYNTLSAKLANLNITSKGISNSLSNYPKLTFDMDENFDVFDIEGEFNEIQGAYVSVPRVEFSSNLGASQTHYNDNSPYVDHNGYGKTDGHDQDDYQHNANQGMSGYLSYLNQSVVSFTSLYNQIVADNPHNIKLTSGGESKTVTTDFSALPTILGYSGGYLRGDYYNNNITYYIRDRKATGYDGPITQSELDKTWSAAVNTQNRNNGLISQFGVREGIESPLKDVDLITSTSASSSTSFTLEYYIPVWTAEDIIDITNAGAWLLSKTYLWDSKINTGGFNNGGVAGGNNGIESDGNIGSTEILQTQTAGSSGSGTPGFGTTHSLGSSNNSNLYNPPVYVNYYEDYLSGRYEALLVQLDMMNDPSKYYQLQNHKGQYKISIQADRAYLAEQIVPGPKQTKDFQYGNTFDVSDFVSDSPNDFGTKFNDIIKNVIR